MAPKDLPWERFPATFFHSINVELNGAFPSKHWETGLRYLDRNLSDYSFWELEVH